MEKLYQNDFVPLFRLIADDYRIEAKTAERAAAIISRIGVTAPAPRKAAQLHNLASTWASKATKIQNGPFVYEVELEEPERCLLEKALDAFSRIVMGQMHILFEITDIPESIRENTLWTCTMMSTGMGDMMQKRLVTCCSQQSENSGGMAGTVLPAKR